MANATTLRKRIALVAAAALGVGLLVAAPANAAFSAGSLTASPATQSVTAPTTAMTTVGLTTTSSAPGDTGTVTATLVAPALSSLTSASILLVQGALTNATGSVTGQVASLTSIAAGPVTDSLTASITPDVAGTYTVTFTPNAFLVGAGVTTFTVTAAAVPTPVFSGATVAGPANFAILTVPTLASFVTIAGSKILSGSTGTAVAADGSSATVPAGGSINIAATSAGTITAKTYFANSPGVYSTNAVTTTDTISAGPVVPVYFTTTVATNALPATSVVSQDSGALLATAVAGTNGVTYVVTQKDQSGVALPAASTHAETITLTGVGTLQINGTTTGNFAAVAAGAANNTTVAVLGDSRAGKATVAIAVDGVVVSTKTVNFYGAVATLTAVANKTILAAASTSTQAATITALDANGTLVPLLPASSFSATSSDGTVITSSGAFAEDNSATPTSFGGYGNYTASVTTAPLAASGSSATVTYKNGTGTSAITAAPVTFKIGGAAATITLKLDKATYAPGAAAILTVTAVDSKGNPAVSSNPDINAGALTSNLASQGLPNASAISTANGTATLKIFAPGTSGTWIISGKDVNGNALSTTAVVSGVAVDTGTAANAAAIALLQKSVADLSTTIASLVASITAQISALSALVKKILAKGGTRGSGSPTLPATGRK